jgi:Family of unknown function (DUF5681)
VKKTQTNPKSLANLKKWVPGQSGNPSGRPHKRPISDRYAEIVETILPDDVRNALGLPKGATYGEAIALGQARQAIKGKPEAAREIREAIEGRTAARDEEGGERRITTILIDRAHRPDWEAMRKSVPVIDVPGMPKPKTNPQT